MKRAAGVAFLIGSISIVCFGQVKKAPTFSAYAAKVESARTNSINFRRSPGAEAFRTRLRGALKAGVNFAGHYVIAGWGCGTGCVSGAVIDARNGRVYFPKEFNAFSVGYDQDEYKTPIEYRKNSRLLVLNGIPGTAHDNDAEGESGTYFYEWRGDRFRLIRFARSSN